MATALVRGTCLGAGLARAGDIVASDPLEAARTSLAAATGISVFDANPPVVERSDVLVLAVKPQTMSNGSRSASADAPRRTPGDLGCRGCLDCRTL